MFLIIILFIFIFIIYAYIEFYHVSDNYFIEIFLGKFFSENSQNNVLFFFCTFLLFFWYVG